MTYVEKNMTKINLTCNIYTASYFYRLLHCTIHDGTISVNLLHINVLYFWGYRARNNGRSTDNVRTDCGFDRSNFRLAGHVDQSKFNRIENEINLRFLLFSCYLSSRFVLRNFDMKSW